MNFLKKWYTYQKERFPVLTYGLYIFCIVFGTYCYYISNVNIISEKNIFWKAMSSNSFELFKNWAWMLIPLFVVTFLQFLMVRIIDEFKDYEEDCKYRSYRPVPRGLVTLKELKYLFLICAILQVGITYFMNGLTSLCFLSLVWVFFLLMTKSFFIKEILDKHIILEVVLDELMIPILIMYLASFIYYIDFNVLKNILLIGYIISCIVEIARKVRCKEDEEEGVKTYTAVFGIPKAVGLLFLLETILGVLVFTVLGVKYLTPIIVVFALVSLVNMLFVLEQKKRYAKLTELTANIYIMLAYLSMGLLIF